MVLYIVCVHAVLFILYVFHVMLFVYISYYIYIYIIVYHIIGCCVIMIIIKKIVIVNSGSIINSSISSSFVCLYVYVFCRHSFALSSEATRTGLCVCEKVIPCDTNLCFAILKQKLLSSP